MKKIVLDIYKYEIDLTAATAAATRNNTAFFIASTAYAKCFMSLGEGT